MPIDPPITSCSHHWLLAPQGGPTSVAVCKLCQATSVFANGEPQQQDWVRGSTKPGR